MKGTFRIFFSVVVPLFLILCVLFYITKSDNARQAKTTLEQTQGYTYYYNGQEVDKDTIDLSMYRYTIDNEKQAVYITDEKQIYYGLPIAIPVITN